MPSIGFVTLDDIFSEGDSGVTVNSNMVIIVESDQFTELQVTCERRSFRRNTFLETAVTENDVGIVVEEFEAWFVEGGSELSFSGS